MLDAVHVSGPGFPKHGGSHIADFVALDFRRKHLPYPSYTTMQVYVRTRVSLDKQLQGLAPLP